MKAVIIASLLLAAIGLAAAQESTETTPISTVTPTPSPWFICPDPNGNFPHPYDCQKYFVCVASNAWMLNCPANLWYDEIRELCDDPSVAVCNATPTKAPSF